ncbi:MAG: hypothetical protein ACREBI_11090 [Nitrosotalea sp.]
MDKKIRNMTKKENIEVLPTIGHYDLITKVTSESSYHLDEIIDEIRRYDKVRSVKVLRADEADPVADVMI